MSNLAVEAAFTRSGLGEHRFKRVLRRVEDRVGEGRDAQRLSLSSAGHLYRREGAADRQQASSATEERSLLVTRDQLVVNPMWLTGGSIAVSDAEGAVSPDYRVFVPDKALLDARYLHHLLRSEPYRAQYNLFVRANTTFDRRIQQIDLDQMPLWLPEVDVQRRIADFLDDRVTRIDQIITARRQQLGAFEESSLRASWDALHGGSMAKETRSSGVPWLGDVPRHWGVLPVASQFQVDLGKMLDEKRQTGAHAIPYLRNTNVQWDRVDTCDLKSMDIEPSERGRFCVEPGDLLICEGGQPGRAAIWDGELEPLGYQKALHRARPRGTTRAEWLLECLRVAVSAGAFAATGQATISHLTNEQLRETKIPIPSQKEQDAVLEELHGLRARNGRIVGAIRDSLERFKEYKQSLITAAVTGEIDVTTAGSGVPG